MNQRFAFLFVWALLSVAAPQASFAQPHGPMGKAPGPELAPASLDTEQDVGTVVVTVLDGSAERPQANLDVTITGKTKQVVRTNASGQAIFASMAHEQYVVSAFVKETLLRSEPFTLPEVGGVAVVLTTAPASASRGGRPSSRMMSGRARPEEKDPSGTLTVRSVQGELGGASSSIPEGALIHLVGVKADGSFNIDTQEVKPETQGRVTFEGLARNNSIAYYAFTIFGRAGGSDRLMTEALRLPPQVGSRMIFAGAPKDSAGQGVDDLVAYSGTGQPMAEAGSVRVRIFAEQSQGKYLAGTSGVELIEIGEGSKPRTATVRTAGPSAAAVLGRSGVMEALPGTEAGQVSFYAVQPSLEQKLADVTIRVSRSDGEAGAKAIEQTTNAQGRTFFRDLEVGVSYLAVASLFGKDVRSEAFVPSSEKGLSIAFAFEWPEQDMREAVFSDVAGGPTKVFIAKVFSEGRNFLSMPFQLTAHSGATVGIYMYPELLFSMHGGAELDDTRLWFQSQVSIANPGIAPLQVSGSGVSIPLPKGFLGASVSDEMASRVGVQSDKGFLWRGAVPPGQRDFIATFALPVEEGGVSFDMELPFGLRAGRMVIEDIPGMQLRTPPGAKVVNKTQPNGRVFLEMPEINIDPQQRLHFAIDGLPQKSIWARRVRIAVGLLAVVLVLWTMFVVFLGRRSPEQVDPVLAGLEATRETLMQQLVQLESQNRHKKIDTKPYQKQRDRLSSKLADTYRKIDEHKSSESSVS